MIPLYQRVLKMSDCKYCGGDCPEQVDKNGEARAEFICDGYELYLERNRPIMESTITTIFKGEYVQVDMVDETIELTVENNVYSFSESYELLDELQKACAISEKANSMVSNTYSQQMQDDLEPIGGMAPDWTFHTTDDYLELEETDE